MAGKRPPLLALSVDEAVARIARSHLDAAARALPKIGRAGNGRNLHAFRVAVRRLRSLLSAYRPWLGKLAGRKMRRALRDLTRSTNAARDIDVELSWLAAERRQLASEDRPGFDWLKRRLANGRRDAYRSAANRLRRDFPGVAKRARKRMNGSQAGKVPAFRTAWLERLDAESANLRKSLATISGANDDKLVHKARIQNKRLRYLIEPLRNELAEARDSVRPLKKLQKILGELHDRNVLEAALADALDEAATEKARRLHRMAVAGRGRKAVADARRPDEALGLVVLAARARDEREELFGKFRSRLAASGHPFLGAELTKLRAAAAHGR
jgi:CHAD domain-containing protein